MVLHIRARLVSSSQKHSEKGKLAQPSRARKSFIKSGKNYQKKKEKRRKIKADTISRIVI